MVLVGPWPQMNATSSPSGRSLSVDGADQRGAVAAGKVGASHRTVEQHVAHEREALIGRDEHDAAGRMAGAMQHIQGEVADSDLFALRQPSIGRDVAAHSRCRRRGRSPSDDRARGRSASCGPSIGTPSSSLSSAAPPAWSIWPCVRRIFSTFTPFRGDGVADAFEIAARIDHGAHLGPVGPQQGAILLERRDRDDGGAEI